MGWGRAAPGWSRSHVPRKSSPGNENRAGRGMRRDWKNDYAQEVLVKGNITEQKGTYVRTVRICCRRPCNRSYVDLNTVGPKEEDQEPNTVHCRAAKNSDFVRVIGFFNPPLRVRTDIYAINDLFGLWTRYKIGINLNYSDTSHFAHAHGTS